MSLAAAYQLPPQQMIDMIHNGLPAAKQPHRILIVGAGMSGLVAASLLRSAGHEVEIIEANSRAGGRVFTIRTPFSNGLFYNAGAYRIPDVHYLTMAYVKKYNLPLDKLRQSDPLDLLYVNGQKIRRIEYERNPALLRYQVAPHEEGLTASTLYQLALQPVVDYFHQDPTQHWPHIVSSYDSLSLDNYLRQCPSAFGVPLSAGAIEMINVLLDNEGMKEYSLLEFLMSALTYNQPGVTFYELVGGMDLLPDAFLPQLSDLIHYNNKVTKVIQHADQVTLSARQTRTNQVSTFSADYCIITLPFSVLRQVELLPFTSFSLPKRQAIRELRYMSGTKVAIEFKHRFWIEQDLNDRLTVSDLPLRMTYYPDHVPVSAGPGIILASYTLGNDTTSWDGLNNEERVRSALQHLAVLHGEQVYTHFVKGTSFSWNHNPYSCGAFSYLIPNQARELYPHLCTQEGKVFFAGEHTTFTHGWVQGAIESGIRAAYEVNLK
ncbi:flavin monoamine oxidase family protein [Paenibacillus sp. ACRRX]|uniref:flavin monoamine oxidase family protein n=1 Tax=Paenibacillus sp. ACRRX TaxID=2918206 RepID=UPI001EF5A8B4|nr:flavin monoamine oxidase family protein [Paenibacillus sp. ACRRX]MCG7407217.1 flavin monoamine oxidase family protein [Paenibacillus sp. ACRRX]